MNETVRRKQLAAALRRVAEGDRTALRLVYDETAAKLFGVCLRILGEHGEAEDVLQEVYVTVWRKAADFDAGRASPMSWLIAIARNRSIDRLRASSSALAAGDLSARAAERGPAELAELARSFNEMAEDLNRIFDARRELVAWASHDLRTPIASLQANRDALARQRG